MANFPVERIRNIAVVAGGGAGKTSLVEAMLFCAGATTRLGSTAEGTTVTDFEPEEMERKITVSSALAYCDWQGHRVNLIDTPGFVNLLEDTKGSMRAADTALVVVNAIAGIRGETERVWAYAEEFGIPRVVFVNAMDREAADFASVLAAVTAAFKKEAIPLTFPIGSGESFKGVVDVLNMKAYTYQGGKPQEGAIPADLKPQADEYRAKLMERVAESDDSLIEKYLNTGELTQEEMVQATRQASLMGCFIPVTCGSALKNIGVHAVLDAVTLTGASPVDMALIKPITGKSAKDEKAVKPQPKPDAPFSAYVFKTVADPFSGKLSMFKVFSGTLKADSTVLNPATDTRERIGQVFHLMGKKHNPATSLGPGEIGVVAKLKDTHTGDTLCDEGSAVVLDRVAFAEPLIFYAIEAKNKGEEDKVSAGLHRILEEDPTLRFSRDEEAQEMLLAGMGQLHLEITLEKLKRKFGVEVVMKAPKIPYRETIRAKASAQGRYKKQSGGRGQFGDCWITIEPLPRGSGYEFVNSIVGGSIPRNYVPAVDKGIQEAMKEGIYAGYQMIDVRVSVYDGSYHAVDSSEMAFKIAGSFAIKKAVPDAKPVVLEPIMKVDITTPDEYLGPVIGDLNSRRGKVHGMDPGNGHQRITALVPMAEMLTYANVLQSITQGRGVYTMEFSTYEDLPAHLTQKLLDERVKHKEEEK